MLEVLMGLVKLVMLAHDDDGDNDADGGDDGGSDDGGDDGVVMLMACNGGCCDDGDSADGNGDDGGDTVAL